MTSTKMRPISVRVPESVAEDIEVLAYRHGVDASEIVRQFLLAGVRANPAPSKNERAGAARKRAGDLPGLVVLTRGEP